MAPLTTKKSLSRETDFNELHHKIKKNFSNVLRKKKHSYETGVKSFCHHFSLPILFWFQQICKFAHFSNVNKNHSPYLDEAISKQNHLNSKVF